MKTKAEKITIIQEWVSEMLEYNKDFTNKYVSIWRAELLLKRLDETPK